MHILALATQWKYIPDLVVGRPIIDNWLVWYSRMTNSKIIDSTFTALALHQRANGFVKKVNFCNSLFTDYNINFYKTYNSFSNIEVSHFSNTQIMPFA
jgi:hypothetical protein